LWETQEQWVLYCLAQDGEEMVAKLHAIKAELIRRKHEPNSVGW
jgi:hypothetical protein